MITLHVGIRKREELKDWSTMANYYGNMQRKVCQPKYSAIRAEGLVHTIASSLTLGPVADSPWPYDSGTLLHMYLGFSAINLRRKAEECEIIYKRRKANVEAKYIFLKMPRVNELIDKTCEAACAPRMD